MHRIMNWLPDKTKKKNVLNSTAAGLALSVEHLDCRAEGRGFDSLEAGLILRVFNNSTEK